jgi:hypothetical protein
VTNPPEVTELCERLRAMAAAIRLYEGGPSAEEGTALEAAVELQMQADRLASLFGAAIGRRLTYKELIA